AQTITVVKPLGIQLHSSPQIGNAAGSVFLQPSCDTQVIVRLGKPRVQANGSFEPRDRFAPALKYGQQESDFILKVGGIRLERGCLLEQSQRSDSVTSRLAFSGLVS